MLHWNVVSAIFRRNLISYFSTPTGYVFICLFVLLSSFAAFWPDEFFNANLANLDQLNLFIPGILLIFIPAITMSIWTEERRQGTDELLLTLPAADLDVVLGKYLAALGIYSIALLFSLFCSFAVLYYLSDSYLDYGLFFCNYFGYWLLGLAMLAIGMVASFVSNNLTVSFILGVLFNAPFVLFQWAGSYISNEGWAKSLKELSFSYQFRDFGKGVFSLPAIVFFLGIIALGLYLCMVLIGRRHWAGGKDGESLWWHYLVRFSGLAAAVWGVNLLFSGHALGRADLSDQRLNSLSANTLEILNKLPADKPVTVEAFVSPILPEEYQQQRMALENFMRELESRSGGKVTAKITTVEPDTEAAERADETYGIKPVIRVIRERGVDKEVPLYMGLAFTSGRKKDQVLFVDKDLPLEYELIHHIWTITRAKQEKIGIIKTQAQVLGPDVQQMMMMRQRPQPTGFESFIEELRKQYDVEEVKVEGADSANPLLPGQAAGGKLVLTNEVEIPDPEDPKKTKKIEENIYKMLIVVQPSTLDEPGMENLLAAIQDGQKTLIFEDPLPARFRGLPGTYNGMLPPPNELAFASEPADPLEPPRIERLWQTLGVKLEILEPKWSREKEKLLNARRRIEVKPPESLKEQRAEIRKRMTDPELNPTKIVWSNFLPVKKLADVPRELLFLSQQDPQADAAFNPESAITAKLDMIAMMFAGSLVKLEEPRKSSGGSVPLTSWKYLVRSGKSGGYVAQGDLEGLRNQLELRRYETPADQAYVVAARIRGLENKDAAKRLNLPMADEGSPEKARQAQEQAKAVADNALAAAAKEGAQAADSPAPFVAPVAVTKRQPQPLDVILVSDIDLLSSLFFDLRQNRDQLGGIALYFDNVTFVMNMVDELAGETNFLEIRKRGFKPNTLRTIDAITEESRTSVEKQEEEFQKEYTTLEQSTNANLLARKAAIESQKESLKTLHDQGKIETAAYRSKTDQLDEQMGYYEEVEVEAATNNLKRKEAEKDYNIKKLRRDSTNDVQKTQNAFKQLAIFLPPIPPLVVAFFVYFSRRAKEKEGVNLSRLK